MVKSARPRSLNRELLWIQISLLLTMAAAVILCGFLIGPPLFRAHLDAALGTTDPHAFEHARIAFRTAGTTSLAVGLLVSGLCSIFIWRSLTRRLAQALSELGAAAVEVAAGHYDHPVQPHQPFAELIPLAESVISMSQRLHEVDTTRRRLMMDVAHEVRTPLAAIDLIIDGLEDGVLPPDSRTFDSLRAQSRRLVRLTADLREVASAEEGALTVVPQPTLIAAECVRWRSDHQSAFDKAGVELIFDALPPPDAVASVDAARLRQIVGNLLSNALRHTPSGGRVWVSTRIADGELAVDVADTGDGIAADHLSRVFERFFSTSTARDTTGGGTGVGLPISRSLARAHGGDVTAKSPGLGRGSVFSVRLPASLDQTLTIDAPF